MTESKRAWPTVVVWVLHIACVTAVAAFATAFVLMATSLDPMQILTAGAEPWTDALAWTGAAVGIAIVSAAGLWMWHSRRLRPIGAALLVIEIGGVFWAGASIYFDYF